MLESHLLICLRLLRAAQRDKRHKTLSVTLAAIFKVKKNAIKDHLKLYNTHFFLPNIVAVEQF